ncbi:MAG: hypothetical protein MK105_06930 [Crocinitomicaceae bacterium]|nr:hypothetical protein [Crocinitomicaceae bacterium]
MKFLIPFLLVTLIAIGCNSHEKTAKEESKENILFIGNSYTYRNGGVDYHLRRLVKGVNDIDSTYITRAAQGKYHLYTHWNDKKTLAKLLTRKWDKVILQEYSSGPTKETKEFFKYGKRWKERLKKLNPQTEILLYATWGYKQTTKMVDSLDVQYSKLENEIDAYKVPVGLMWKSLKEKVNLYDADNAHPNRKGTFITACLFYEYLFNKDVTKTPHIDHKLSIETQNQLKNWAHEFHLEMIKKNT